MGLPFFFSGERVLEIFKGGGGAYGSSSIMGICHHMLKCQEEDRVWGILMTVTFIHMYVFRCYCGLYMVVVGHNDADDMMMDVCIYSPNFP